jgi:tRNA(adenine34) deaminase
LLVTELMYLSYDRRFMERAIELAKAAAEIGEVPVGAVVVKSGNIVGEGYNRRETAKDPTAHAEIIAIKKASETLGGWRLVDCDMYVTLEPCIMCSGAIINSRIRHLYIGAFDKKAGAVISNSKLLDEAWTNHKTDYASHLEDEASSILTDFFADLRRRKSK